jgi:hypothetical protein
VAHSFWLCVVVVVVATVAMVVVVVQRLYRGECLAAARCRLLAVHAGEATERAATWRARHCLHRLSSVAIAIAWAFVAGQADTFICCAFQRLT